MPNPVADKKENTPSSDSTLHLVWKALLGGLVGALLGTLIYPDFGTIIGATLGVILGVSLGHLFLKIDIFLDEKTDTTLAVSERARAFFADLAQPIPEKKIKLPFSDKKKSKHSDHEQEYALQLFNTAITSRGTGAFPGNPNKPKPPHDTSSEQ
ncbi:MAG: hypothetical protein HY939_04945 [Gammaproteobacteria bacterium]|nr:hypothetical protein [Gammaproteobacteria bacterium]